MREFRSVRAQCPVLRLATSRLYPISASQSVKAIHVNAEATRFGLDDWEELGQILWVVSPRACGERDGC